MVTLRYYPISGNNPEGETLMGKWIAELEGRVADAIDFRDD